jgi:hypothetical protein
MMSIVKAVNIDTFEPGYVIRFAIVDTFLGNIVKSKEISLHDLGPKSFDLVAQLEKIDPDFLFTTEDIMRLPRGDEPVVKAAEEVLKKNSRVSLEPTTEMVSKETVK